MKMILLHHLSNHKAVNTEAVESDGDASEAANAEFNSLKKMADTDHAVSLFHWIFHQLICFHGLQAICG